MPLVNTNWQDNLADSEHVDASGVYVIVFECAYMCMLTHSGVKVTMYVQILFQLTYGSTEKAKLNVKSVTE